MENSIDEAVRKSLLESVTAFLSCIGEVTGMSPCRKLKS